MAKGVMHTSLVAPGTCPVLQFCAIFHSTFEPPPVHVTVHREAVRPEAAGPEAARAGPPPATTSTTGTARPSARRGQAAGTGSLLIESPFFSLGTRPRRLHRPPRRHRSGAAWPLLPIRLTAPSGLRTRQQTQPEVVRPPEGGVALQRGQESGFR